MENFLIPAIIGLMMYLLFAASKKKPKEDNLGNMVLKLPKFYAFLGLIVLLAGVGLLLFSLIWAIPTDKRTAAISGVLALITGMFFFAKGYISGIRITETGLVETTMFGNQNSILWKEISDVSFGSVSLELKIKSPQSKIKAHMHMVGFPVLVQQIEAKTGRSCRDLGIPA